MSSTPALTGAQVVRALQRLGFSLVRIRGSHYFVRHADGRCTVVPVHRGESIGRGLLARILRDCEITGDEHRRHV